MIVPLTLRLIAVPEHAWPRLTAACASGEGLPSPMAHAAVVGTVSVLATTFGAAIASHTSVGNVIITLLLAVVGYIGAGAVVVFFADSIIQSPEETRSLRSRFGSAAVLPLAVSGTLNFAPVPVLGLVWTLFGGALMAWSAYVGASALLGLEGAARRSVAGTVTAAGIAPVILSTLVRILVTR